MGVNRPTSQEARTFPFSGDRGVGWSPREAGAKVCLGFRPAGAPRPSPSAPATHHDSAPRPGSARSSQREPTATARLWRAQRPSQRRRRVQQPTPRNTAAAPKSASGTVAQGAAKGAQQLGLTRRSDVGGACRALNPGLLKIWKSNACP